MTLRKNPIKTHFCSFPGPKDNCLGRFTCRAFQDNQKIFGELLLGTLKKSLEKFTFISFRDPQKSTQNSLKKLQISRTYPFSILRKMFKKNHIQDHRKIIKTLTSILLKLNCVSFRILRKVLGIIHVYSILRFSEKSTSNKFKNP